MSEQYIIDYCSPTLAGLKTANLFICDCEDEKELAAQIRVLNRRLSQRGLCIVPLKVRDHRAMIYVYRPLQLARDLMDSAAAGLLKECGYTPEKQNACIGLLSKKLQNCPDSSGFPHEIGLFLGYPPEDVRGFMEKRHSLFSGYWQVYSDEAGARKKFAGFSKCTRIYREVYSRGASIEKLTVKAC